MQRPLLEKKVFSSHSTMRLTGTARHVPGTLLPAENFGPFSYQILRIRLGVCGLVPLVGAPQKQPSIQLYMQSQYIKDLIMARKEGERTYQDHRRDCTAAIFVEEYCI